MTLLLALFLSLPSHAGQRVVNCNFNFGSVEEVEIDRETNSSLSFKYLANGTWQTPIQLSDEQARNKDISFVYRGERFHFYFQSRQWHYDVYSNETTTQPNTVGIADCS